MKKSTKVVLLTAITMAFCGCSPEGVQFRGSTRYLVYGPGSNIEDSTDDVAKNMMIEIQDNQIDLNSKE